MDEAGPVSQMFFLWAGPIMRRGFRQALQGNEALALPACLLPDPLHERFTASWQQEVQSTGKRAREPSVLWALWRLLGADVRAAVYYQLCIVVIQFGYVLLLRWLTVVVREGGDRNTGLSIAVSLGVLNLVEGNLFAHGTWRLQLATHGLVTIFAQAVLRKGMKLHPDARAEYSRGSIVSLGLSESTRLLEVSSMMLPGLTVPIVLLSHFVLLLVLVGPSVLVAAVVACAMLYSSHIIGRAQGAAFLEKSIAQGRRLGLLNELLQSIRFTKFYGLEEHYEGLMTSERSVELRQLLRMKVCLGSIWPVAACVSTLVSVVTLLTHLGAYGSLPNPEDTAAVLASARLMYVPCAFFGNTLAVSNMMLTACKRLGRFLLQPEIIRQQLVREQGEMAVDIPGRSFVWNAGSEEPTLKDLTLRLPRGELWVIVGGVGSGKSSVLQCILGELQAVDGTGEGTVVVRGSSRAYVAQEPTIINASVRENILFGTSELDVDLRAYAAALEAAALVVDLKTLPANDETEIGEKGITLSGGQKARVAMARAIYGSRSGGLVLLDDPLAAVDAQVGLQLFDACICKALASTTRLLVTNQLQLLKHPSVSRVLMMEHGSIVEQGSFAELVTAGGPFSRLLGSATKVHEWEKQVYTNSEAKVSGFVASAVLEDKAAGMLTQAEQKEEGAVSSSTLGFYITRLGGCWVFFLMVLWCWAFHISEFAPDVFFALWQDDVLLWKEGDYAVAWLVLSMLCVLIGFLCRQLTVVFTMRVSRRIHTEVLSKVLHSTMSFFDRTPSGRIMNRLGEDIAMTDWTAALQLEVLILCIWRTLDCAALPIIARPWVGPAGVVVTMLFLMLREVHRRACREAIRWWMVTKSPVFSIFEEVLAGVVTICAAGQEEHFQTRYSTAVKANVEWLLSRDATNVWTSQRLSILGSAIVAAVCVLIVLTPGQVPPYLGVVCVVYSLLVCESLRFTVFFLVTTEGTFASVERIKSFTLELEQEPPWNQSLDPDLERDGWPSADAELVFDAVNVRYLPHLPMALREFSVRLKAKENVGVVGRTGSGKSTLMGALFGLVPVLRGSITLGGVNTASVGLRLLRRRITIVPQDPVLFSGKLRRNLDPLEACEDSAIWAVLQRCNLEELVRGMGLEAAVAEGGSNFSVGERQLLCLARALLRRSGVLCLDEATANVDPRSDENIQRILRMELGESIVLTIAHRLRTVLHCDRILVLDRGSLEQCDSPEKLLEQPGIFRSLATSAGIVTVDDTEEKAPDRIPNSIVAGSDRGASGRGDAQPGGSDRATPRSARQGPAIEICAEQREKLPNSHWRKQRLPPTAL